MSFGLHSKLVAFDGVGTRLALVLAVALLPLAIVSVVRSQSVLTEARARSAAALSGETLNAISTEIALIEEANGASRALSSVMGELLDHPEVCNRAMRTLTKNAQFSFAGFHDLTGYAPCSSAPAPFSFGLTDNIKAQIEDPKTIVLVNENGPASGTSVFYSSSPVYDANAKLIGFAVVSVPHNALRAAKRAEEREGFRNVVFLTMNAHGKVLTSSIGLENAAGILPADTSFVKSMSQRTSFSAETATGDQRTYALVPVLPGQVYALGSWPTELSRNDVFYLQHPAVFPFLMWLASLAVAWFASELFVTRHVLALRRSMQNFAQSRRTGSNEAFAAAPLELREMAEAYMDMTQSLLRDEANLENTVRQKDILLREVHHRVKNNLQLIASIMNMQMRQSPTPEVRGLMRSLHDRVMSLATVHRGLYQTTGTADVRADELLGDIVRQVSHMATADQSSIDLQLDLDHLKLNPDQAVPLSLLVTEALTNALKYIGTPDDKRPFLRVSLKRDSESSATLTVTNSVSSYVTEPNGDTSSGLGGQLIEAFSQQLGGLLSSGNEDGTYFLRVRFEVEPLVPKPVETV